MKKLGLIGGTSWHSTVEYYKTINQQVNHHFGNNTNPPLLVYTLNQALIHQYQIEDNWESIASLLIEAAQSLERAGAEMVLFCANTPHKVYPKVKEQIDIPILHIADATSVAIKAQNLEKVCFLGTKYSMEENFLRQRFESNGIRILTPENTKTIEELHRIIQEELTYGRILSSSKSYVLKVIHSLEQKGAQGVVLGCTEFPLMIGHNDLTLPIFNTTEIHAKAGIAYILTNYTV